jgi:predicted transcriptional regulator
MMRRAAGELANEILAVLWAANKALTPGEIQAELVNPPAYNTVHTILTRLHDKGLVVRDTTERRGAYRAAKDPAVRTAELMRDLLDAGPDRLGALQRFATQLRPDEERALRSLLRPESAED